MSRGDLEKMESLDDEPVFETDRDACIDVLLDLLSSYIPKDFAALLSEMRDAVGELNSRRLHYWLRQLAKSGQVIRTLDADEHNKFWYTKPRT